MDRSGGNIDVSVIIPAYNRLWCLPAAVASCRGTRCRTEIIVVDDGSVDGTWEWLAAQPDLVALRQVNLGKDWAVALAMRHARGRYVKFLDSDDLAIAAAIDAQVVAGDRERADVVVSGMEDVDGAGRTTAVRPYVVNGDFIAQQLGEGDGSHYSAFLFRRDFIADIPHRQEYGGVDDRMFILEVALAQPSLAVVDMPALRHVSHDGERLQHVNGLRYDVKNWCLLEVYRRILGRLTDADALTPRRARAAAGVLWRLAHDIARTHPREGRDVAAWVYRLAPDFRAPEAGFLGRAYDVLGFAAVEAILRARRRALTPFRVGERVGQSLSA